jgi:hypothetical protein
LIGDVRDKRLSGAALGLDLRYEFFRPIRIPIDDRDCRARVGKQTRGLRAYTVARAGDRRHLAVKPEEFQDPLRSSHYMSLIIGELISRTRRHVNLL